MRRNVRSAIFIIITFIFLISGNLQAVASEPDEIVIRYFQALKHGDTDVVKTLITDKLYQKRITLLEKNSTYSFFLKRLYEGVTVRIVNVNKDFEKVYITVAIESQDGSNSPVTLILKKDSNEKWKISDEIVTH